MYLEGDVDGSLQTLTLRGSIYTPNITCIQYDDNTKHYLCEKVGTSINCSKIKEALYMESQRGLSR